MAKEIQTVIFSKEKGNWTLDKAKKWLKDHDFHSNKVDETEQSWRFRQFNPSECREGSYQTLTENFPEGISAVSCERKKDCGDYELKIASLKRLLEKADLSNTDFVVSKRDDKEILIIRKHYSFETKKQDTNIFSHPISDGKKDRDWDMINPDGWDLKNYRKNPVVMYGHDYRELPIGRNKRIWKENGRLMATTEFDPNDEFAQKVQQKYEDGFMKGWSVGFIPLEWETYHDEKSGRSGVKYNRAELLEYSAVPIPANPRAIASVGKAIEEEIEKKDYHEPTFRFNLLEPNVIEPLTKDEKELLKRAVPVIAKLFKASEPSKDSSGSIYDLILGDHGEEPNDPDKRNLSEDDIARMIALKLKLALLTKTMKT